MLKVIEDKLNMKFISLFSSTNWTPLSPVPCCRVKKVGQS